MNKLLCLHYFSVCFSCLALFINIFFFGFLSFFYFLLCFVFGLRVVWKQKIRMARRAGGAAAVQWRRPARAPVHRAVYGVGLRAPHARRSARARLIEKKAAANRTRQKVINKIKESSCSVKKKKEKTFLSKISIFIFLCH
jgi:hypothetical protein